VEQDASDHNAAIRARAGTSRIGVSRERLERQNQSPVRQSATVEIRLHAEKVE
jgi:hypothetical protein